MSFCRGRVKSSSSEVERVVILDSASSTTPRATGPRCEASKLSICSRDHVVINVQTYPQTRHHVSSSPGTTADPNRFLLLALYKGMHAKGYLVDARCGFSKCLLSEENVHVELRGSLLYILLDFLHKIPRLLRRFLLLHNGLFRARMTVRCRRRRGCAGRWFALR